MVLNRPEGRFSVGWRSVALTRATASDLSEVTLTFTSPFNQPSASGPNNYTLTKNATVLQVRFDEQNPNVLHLTTKGLEAATTYTLTVANVFSTSGKPLTPNKTEFTTP
jgi:hypothetical protein